MLTVDPQRPDPDSIARAAAVLRAGGLVAFPTETVYGLGAHAFDEAAVRRIFAAKGRPFADPIIVHVLGEAELDRLASRMPASARLLARALWPGPLTLIVPKAAVVPDVVTAGRGSVAVRAPSHPVARALLAAAGLPIAAPSANPFGRTSPTRAEHVVAELGSVVDLVLDGGPCSVGVESTVVDTCVDPPRVLRPGGVTLEALRAVIPGIVSGHPFESDLELERDSEPGPMVDTASYTETSPASGSQMPGRRSPGTRVRHYAPRARVLLLTGEPAALRAGLSAASEALAARGMHVGLLAADEMLSGSMDAHDLAADAVEHMRASATAGENATAEASAHIHRASLGPASTPEVAARRLFEALRTLDSAGVDVVLAADPGTVGLALAVRDRLSRAAEGRLVAARDLEAVVRAAVGRDGSV